MDKVIRVLPKKKWLRVETSRRIFWVSRIHAFKCIYIVSICSWCNIVKYPKFVQEYRRGNFTNNSYCDDCAGNIALIIEFQNPRPILRGVPNITSFLHYDTRINTARSIIMTLLQTTVYSLWFLQLLIPPELARLITISIAVCNQHDYKISADNLIGVNLHELVSHRRLQG